MKKLNLKSRQLFPPKIKFLLRELLKQSIIPNEIIVVDDSNNFETRYVIESLRHAFSKRNIKLFYTRDSNSAARARLIGGLMAQLSPVHYGLRRLQRGVRFIERMII